MVIFDTRKTNIGLREDIHFEIEMNNVSLVNAW